MKVKDFMIKNVCCATPDTKISDVAKMMSENHIGSIPVCDSQNSICGILTDRDIILRGVACGKDVNSTPISDIMSCNVCSCDENDSIEKAEKTMSQNQIRRLPVCDENKHVIGIITLGDLANNNEEIGVNEVCNTFSNVCNSNENKNAE